MSTISNEHRNRLKALHGRDPNFGVIGNLWAERVVDYMQATCSMSLLDYGAGRSQLTVAVARLVWNPAVEYASYEPAFGHEPPQPADFVTCIDVMEHVEEDKVRAVMLDLLRCARKGLLLTISLRNGTKKNRDTHPMAAHSREFWRFEVETVFSSWFTIEEVAILDPTKAKSEVAFLMRKK